jgi:hypothetical protein
MVLVLFFGQLAFGEAALPFAGVLALLAAALLLAHHVVSRPKRQYRQELDYRSGMGPFSQYVAEAEAMLRQRHADWAVLFKLRGLPHGGYWWLQVVVNEGPPASARADLWVRLKWTLPGTRVERDVPDDIVQDLLTLLNGLDLSALTDVPSFVRDGAPCHVTVLRREPRCVTSARCNLGDWWTAEPLQHPTAAVCSKLDSIARRLSPER